MVNLTNVNPPLLEVARLGDKALRVYSVLFEAAQSDNRGECGGTTSWSIKGLASETGMERRTVSSALNKLLDAGFIQINGESRNKGNSNNTIWRVTHPDMMEAVRYAIGMMGPTSERLKKMRVKQTKTDISKYQEPNWGQ